jgi:iron(III) transport system substrate-binding protein
MRRTLAIAAVLVLAAAAAAAAAGPFTPDPVDLAAAKKEGGVTWYTSTPVATAQKIATMFQQETGIKVELFRSGGSAVLRRFMQESDARRTVADVLTISDPAAAGALVKRDQLVAFRPRNFDKVPDAAKDPKGLHVAQRLNLIGIVVRTDKVVDPPKTWTDLTDPKWKGKMVMPDPSFTAIQLMVVGALSQKYGWDFYRKLRANDTMIVQSHQQVSETLTRGERVVAAEAVDSYTWLARQAGHKVQTIFPADGAFTVAAPTMVIKSAPHPNAAKALAEFMISDEVQKLFPGEGIYAARSDVSPPPGNPPLSSIKLLPIDYGAVDREAKSLKNRFNEIFQ